MPVQLPLPLIPFALVADYASSVQSDTRSPAAQLAEHTFLQYQRLLQREVGPELVIQLPNVFGEYGSMLAGEACLWTPASQRLCFLDSQISIMRLLLPQLLVSPGSRI